MTELSPQTRALLEAGRHRPGLTPAHRDRLKGRILARAAGAAVVTTATGAAAWTSLGAKVLGGLVLVAATGAAVAAGTGAWSRHAEPTPSGVVRAAPPRAVATSSPALVVPAERATTTPVERAAVAPPEPPPRRAERAAPPLATASHIAEDTAASSESVAQLAPPPSMPAPSPDTAGTFPAEVGSVRTNDMPASTPAESRLEQEVHLLREADLAVKGGDPERALLLLDRHAAAFPRSTLEPERMAERVFALCRAGRVAQARAEAATFLTVHPEGPLALRVRSSCSDVAR
jgi:hypothetical protein